ncbi:hypothetical protein BXZ70DRAFT_914068 [Cristinia sonorae]|uniref:Calcineurin-like phosphoesterase domain-containing protein n=1 Tax=Cristinia sonorae TaxID=1940300 RepID=A0A8K0V0U8_9AGAR|nr:hypothetical protein BXZ70DRAFT_914068 [Cristinia sonorae]
MPTRLQSQFLNRWPLQLSLISYLRIAWILVLLWCEFGSFSFSLLGCRWPDSNLQSSGDITHVLLVTDPQVRYLPRVRRRWADKWKFASFHRTLQKNWQYAYGMEPDIVVFLGDMLAHGHHLDDDNEYKEYFHRFQELLPADDSVTKYYAPGNEDVGLRINERAAREVRRRFQENFGPLNQAFTLSGHNFVLLDAPGLVEEDYYRTDGVTEFANISASPGGALEFTQRLTRLESNHPTILFTHIPLARPELASCGPLREHGTIRRGVGAGYQNTLGKRTTHFLLNTIHPTIVFSGDDRDHCDYSHRKPDGDSSDGIREVTLKSLSPFRHISHPGFHLLSLINPVSALRLESPTFADRACFLPDYHGVYTKRYLPLAVLTLAALLISRCRRRKQQHGRLPSYNSPSDPLDKSEYAIHQGGKHWQWSPKSRFAKQEASMRSSPPIHTSPLSSSPTTQSFIDIPTHPKLQPYQLHDEPIDLQDDDHMCPTPYTPRVNRSGSGSTTDGTNGDVSSGSTSASWLADTTSPAYLPESSTSRHKHKRGWTWSWRFVLFGRTRRMTVSIPWFGSSNGKSSPWSYQEADWTEKLGLSGNGKSGARRRSRDDVSGWLQVLKGSLVDYWHVCWPATVSWILLFITS